MPRLTTFLSTLVLSVLLLGSPSAYAQTDARTLTIKDGEIHIDGTRLSQDELPSSLDVSGVSAQYRFVGIEQPVVELNGQLYAVGSTLTRVSEDEIRNSRRSVILQGLLSREDAPTQGLSAARSSQGAADRSVQQENMHAEHQEYLRDLQQRSHDLYDRLVHERRMEAETYELARVIRLLPEGPERQAKIDTLRSMLNDIFELKQENRRREIEHLQRQISEIQRSLQKRQEMRSEMIEKRMQQLVTSGEQQDSQEP